MSERSPAKHTRIGTEPFGPVGHLIADARRALQYSLADTARAINKAARETEGVRNPTCSASTVRKWIHDGVIPQPASQRSISVALHIPREHLDAAIDEQRPRSIQQVAPSSETSYDPDDMKRRQFMERALVMLGGASTADLNSDLPIRLLRALTRPSTVDPETANYLDRRVSECWQTWSAQILPSAAFLPFVQDDLHRISTLLEGSLPTGIRNQLTATAGGFAMLAGVLLWDMRSYGDSRQYLRLATTASLVSNRPTLGAVAHGWMSFAWSYDAESRETLTEALLSVKAAQSFPSVSSRVRLWLAAVEAEIHAKLGDHRACLDALHRAEGSALLDSTSGQEEYWTHYDVALLAGYKGSCYLRLSKPHEAQTALTEALKLSSPQRRRVLPNLFADLGRAYAMDGHIEEACEAGSKALESAGSRSVAHLRRLDILMDDLEPWKDAAGVRSLRERLIATRERR